MLVKMETGASGGSSSEPELTYTRLSMNASGTLTIPESDYVITGMIASGSEDISNLRVIPKGQTVTWSSSSPSFSATGTLNADGTSFTWSGYTSSGVWPIIVAFKLN